MVKYSEKIDIRGHYTDLKGRLIVKSLCDLFNDVADLRPENRRTHVERAGVDVDVAQVAYIDRPNAGAGRKSDVGNVAVGY